MKKNYGQVSIIVPVYNAEKFVEETIKSVLLQSYENWELLMINDASKDKSYEILSKYEKLDKRIKIINMEKNVGVVKGRNLLVDKAKGKYIAFLDADDYWDEKKLEKQLEFMQEKNAAISCTEYIRIKENGEEINKIKIKEKIEYNDLLKNNYLGCSTVIYDVEKIGKRFFNKRDKNEDFVLWLEIIKEVQVVYGLQEPLMYYRILNNSRSSNKLEAAKDRWEIYKKIEKIPFFKRLYYFIIYILIALKKTR